MPYPDCPKCHAGGEKHVSLVVIIVYDKEDRVRTDFACNCCGHAWSTLEGGQGVNREGERFAG
jgi:hypothetical protein